MAEPSSTFAALGSTSSLRDGVESKLAAAIVSGGLQPESMVSVPMLAAQFKVSATPVREAILNLEKRGFVQSVRNKARCSIPRRNSLAPDDG
jgi:DNA-binding GntR family transcriptional regulator